VPGSFIIGGQVSGASVVNDIMSTIKERYIVTVDGNEFELEMAIDNGLFVVEHGAAKYTVAADRLTDKKFLFNINNSSSEVDITRQSDTLQVFLEGKEMDVRVEPYYLAELRKRAGTSSGGPEDKTIKAPMPGLILSTKVQPGDKVEKGSALVIIEAMKMENMIKAPFDGTVKEVFVKEGQAVDKNEKLVEVE